MPLRCHPGGANPPFCEETVRLGSNLSVSVCVYVCASLSAAKDKRSGSSLFAPAAISPLPRNESAGQSRWIPLCPCPDIPICSLAALRFQNKARAVGFWAAPYFRFTEVTRLFAFQQYIDFFLLFLPL